MGDTALQLRLEVAGLPLYLAAQTIAGLSLLSNACEDSIGVCSV